jgi:hypothetical protein
MRRINNLLSANIPVPYPNAGVDCVGTNKAWIEFVGKKSRALCRGAATQLHTMQLQLLAIPLQAFIIRLAVQRDRT